MWTLLTVASLLAITYLCSIRMNANSESKSTRHIPCSPKTRAAKRQDPCDAIDEHEEFELWLHKSVHCGISDDRCAINLD